eukprot:1160859-Pelagomonas_calceolata.AAC.11
MAAREPRHLINCTFFQSAELKAKEAFLRMDSMILGASGGLTLNLDHRFPTELNDLPSHNNEIKKGQLDHKLLLVAAHEPGQLHVFSIHSLKAKGKPI